VGDCRAVRKKSGRIATWRVAPLARVTADDVCNLAIMGTCPSRKSAQRGSPQSGPAGDRIREYSSSTPTPVEISGVERSQDRPTLEEEFNQSKVGRFIKRIDKALPGKHTLSLYNGLSREEATALTQLRSGIGHFNDYLAKIKQNDSPACECGAERETVEHFLLHCPRWMELLRMVNVVCGFPKRRLAICLHLGYK
jgi:hypothetical protein